MEPQKDPHSQGKQLLRLLFLQGKRIFTIQDAALITNTKKIPPHQLRKILSNLVKYEQIIRLRRGLYVIRLLPEQTNIHPFVISAHLIQPSAISHWSALQHHGLTEQISKIVTASTPHKVLTPSMRKNHPHKSKSKHIWEIDNVSYEYINIQQRHFFGIEKIWVDEHFQISITDKERTLLDLFAYPKMFGGLGEALGILENSLAIIDIQKLINYAIQYNKKSIIKRLGWALEYFGVSAKQLKALLKVPIHYYCRLDPSAPANGPYDKHWMIQNNLMNMEKR